MKDDTISRRAALDAIKKLEKPAPTAQHLSAIFDCEDTIKALPSAQPTGTKTVQVDDCISRQAAIETVRKAQSIGQAHRMLLQMPSAQLAQDLTNGCTDTISRVAAISICDNAIDLWNGQLGTGALVAVRDAIMALPSAQTERKKGKWIERNPQNSPDCRLIECSECGNAYIVGYSINYDDWIDGRNFCMKCGADLRGGSNGKST